MEETGERYRDQIREIKSLTQAPFAVNIPVGFGAQRKHSKKIAGLINEVKTASEVMDDVMGAISSRFEELRLKLGDFV